MLVLSDSLQSKTILQNTIMIVDNTEWGGFFVLVCYLYQLYI